MKKAARGKPSLMVISDPAGKGTAVSYLTREGFEISTSAYCPEVLARLGELRPDLIAPEDIA